MFNRLNYFKKTLQPPFKIMGGLETCLLVLLGYMQYTYVGYVCSMVYMKYLYRQAQIC